MKLLRIILSIAVCASFNTSIIQTKEASPALEFSKEDSICIKNAFYAAASFIQQIDQIVGDLAQLINKHQIKGITSPDHILRILTEDRQLLVGLLQTISAAQNTEMQLYLAASLLQICNVFIPHIEEGLRHSFKKMSPFDIQLIEKRRIDIDSITPKTLQEMVQKTQNNVEQIKILASQAGLTWYNIAARSFDKNVVSPWNKWHGTTALKTLGGVAALSSYLIWKYGQNSNNTIIQGIYGKLNRFGDALEINGQGKIDKLGTFAIGQNSKSDNSDDPIINMTSLSLLELASNEVAKNHAPIAMFGATALWGFYTETWQKSISPWIAQKQSMAWNFLRGGSYLNAETPGLTSLDPKVNFDHMVGLEEVKEEFKAILEYLDNPEKFLRSGTQPETGWILTGPPRTGKSFSFECLCGEIVRMQKRKGLNPDFKFLKIGIDHIARFSIQGLLDFAKDNAPMIIFVDEIDLLGLQRVGDNKLLHDFLTALQSTQTDDPSKVVIIMAATNSPETLDKALRQYGRLGKEIRFETPGFEYRKQYLIKEFNSMALNPAGFDIDNIVARTPGKTYEDLRAILRKAMTRAWAQGMPLTQHLIDESLDTEINKMIMHDRKKLPETEKRILASHFAGKALAMVLLGTHAQLDKVSTKAFMAEIKEVTAWYNMHTDKKDAQQKIVHGGLLTKYMHDTIELKSETDILNDVKVLIAGFIAEEIMLGSCGMQCHPEDNNKAYSVIDQLVFKGIDPNQLSKAVREQLRDKAYALLMQCRDEARQLLENHRSALTAITEALMKESILSDKQVKAIIEKVEKQ